MLRYSSLLTELVLIDFSNAFNAVNHDLLLATLRHLNISSSAAGWFSSYLQDRRQAVRSDRTFSDWCTVTSGVPQGGILSPLLFSIFINLITSKIKCSYHLYADDLQLYTQASAKDLDQAIAEINLDLNHISTWSHCFGITVNPAKCQAILLGSTRLLSLVNTVELAPVLFETEVIPLSSQVKKLGLTIDSGLTWEPQVSDVSRRVINTLRALYRHKHFLPVSTKTLLVQALVLPVLDYADVCYTNLTQDSLNKFNRLLNSCIRFVFGLQNLIGSLYEIVGPFVFCVLSTQSCLIRPPQSISARNLNLLPHVQAQISALPVALSSLSPNIERVSCPILSLSRLSGFGTVSHSLSDKRRPNSHSSACCANISLTNFLLRQLNDSHKVYNYVYYVCKSICIKYMCKFINIEIQKLATDEYYRTLYSNKYVNLNKCAYQISPVNPEEIPPILKQEVEKAIMSQKLDKAPGPDNIYNELMRGTLEEICPI
ncbi:uncharacterized protein LOC134796967 [Cydia splendana]|uniref:uncharacterized protein LOC134796967 n=1 Tax=Cydia splendana TaxID=1100963 RepID=UPI00300D0F26